MEWKIRAYRKKKKKKKKRCSIAITALELEGVGLFIWGRTRVS